MIKKIFISIVFVLALALIARFIYTAIQQDEEAVFHADLSKTITLASNDFGQNDIMPIELTAYGKQECPELHWSNVPADTKSFVLLCTDYDGPTPLLKLLTIDHWVVYNIPADKTSLPRASTSSSLKSEGIASGKNFKETLDYKGPKPPLGKHRYFFRVYALSTEALNINQPTKKEVMHAMKDHILAYGELIGIY